MPLPGIFGGFETGQKQFFYIFGAKGKNTKKKNSRKNRFFRKISVFYREKSVFLRKYRYLSEKSVIFLPFFYFRFFLPKIVSNPKENRFFAEKSVEKTDFYFLGCY